MRYAIVTEFIEGVKFESVYAKKGAGYIQITYINGERWSEHKIYKVDTGAPYVRDYGKRFVLDGDHYEALKAIKEAA